jgi:hypothetical protein
MDTNLIDKLSLDNIPELISRDSNFRIVINHKIYDTSHEDDIARYVINNTKFKDMLLIRFEYYLSKTYHGLGKGDMVFFDDLNNKLYVLELKSLKDKYSNTTDTSKIEKCIAQSLKYSEYSQNWAIQNGHFKESIPVSVIELLNGNIQITERTIIENPSEKTNDKYPKDDKYLKDDKYPIPHFPWNNTIQKKEQEEINNDKWFTHPGDQTLTRYRINGDTLESERIVDYQPSSGSRRTFRKRVKSICQQVTICNKYLLILKNVQGDIIMQEYHELRELSE